MPDLGVNSRTVAVAADVDDVTVEEAVDEGTGHDLIAEDFGGLGVAAAVAFVALAILASLMPVAVYAVQKWAYRYYQELTKVNKRLGQLLKAVEVQRYAHVPLNT